MEARPALSDLLPVPSWLSVELQVKPAREWKSVQAAH